VGAYGQDEILTVELVVLADVGGIQLPFRANRWGFFTSRPGIASGNVRSLAADAASPFFATREAMLVQYRYPFMIMRTTLWLGLAAHARYNAD
jgi:hypothetical protein